MSSREVIVAPDGPSVRSRSHGAEWTQIIVEPPRTSEPASPGGRGWVRIGGAALADARVEIDGRYVGHVPTLQEVALGARHVVVRNDAGEVLLDREVAVAVEHTQLRPAVVR